LTKERIKFDKFFVYKGFKAHIDYDLILFPLQI
jgi:hypothetical protein